MEALLLCADPFTMPPNEAVISLRRGQFRIISAAQLMMHRRMAWP